MLARLYRTGPCIQVHIYMQYALGSYMARGSRPGKMLMSPSLARGSLQEHKAPTPRVRWRGVGAGRATARQGLRVSGRNGSAWASIVAVAVTQVNATFLTITVAGADREAGHWPLAVESLGSSCSAPFFVLACCGAVLR